MRTRTILLVEDNRDDVELTLHAFRESKAADDIVVVRDGAEALEYLFGSGRYATRDLSTGPDLVLLDLKLPKLDGFEVLRGIRADPRTRRLPVVVLTSSREEQDVRRCYDLGANSFVRKPVDFVEFVEVSRQLGAYWLVLNERSPDAPPAPDSSTPLPRSWTSERRGR
jgi:two-component system response regulator